GIPSPYPLFPHEAGTRPTASMKGLAEVGGFRLRHREGSLLSPLVPHTRKCGSWSAPSVPASPPPPRVGPVSTGRATDGMVGACVSSTWEASGPFGSYG